MTRIEIATRIVAGVIVTPIGREMEPLALVRWTYEVADEILKQDAPKKEDGCRWYAFKTSCGHECDFQSFETIPEEIHYCYHCGREIVE